MKHEIGKNVPIIYDNRRKYPWREMEIGDSFVCEVDGRNLHRGAKMCGIKISSRREGDKYRVWRVA